MNVLVAYMSRTGNTKKVAESIFGEIQEEKQLKELKDVDGLAAHDFAFIGFPIESYGPAEEAKDFLEKHAQGRKIALFITHSAPEYAEVLPGWLAKCKEAAAGAELIAVFNCQGELAQNVIDAMAKHPDPKVRSWAEMANTTKGQPDATRLDKARAFATEVMRKIKQ